MAAEVVASWILIPCLRQLFREFDTIAPERDTASDGAVGDTAHSQTSSDHNPDETGNVPIRDADNINEVHAIDVGSNLNESDLTMEMVVQFLLARCRSGAEKRLRYMIYNRRIWSASSGWVQKTYTGKSPHTEHAHFSASYETRYETDSSPWYLEDIMAVPTAKEIVDELLARQLDFPYGKPGEKRRVSDLIRYIPSRDGVGDEVDSRLARWFNDLYTGLRSATVPAIVTGVLAGLADPGRDLDQLADGLREALGADRAADLGALLRVEGAAPPPVG